MLTPPRHEDARFLREFFENTGYNFDALRGGLPFTDLASFRYRQYLLPGIQNASPLDVIVKWFTCGLPVPADHAGRVIPSRAIEICESSGLLTRDGDALRPAVMLSPFEGCLIASDRIAKLNEDASDLIVWPNASTNQMFNAALRNSGGSMLDLGCGTGALAVACAAKFSAVTASDLNSRAGEFTSFNARLNGVEIECLAGDGFAPVAGRKFDLILCNPPFFLVPSSGLLYCENPMELDSFARSLMRQAPDYLNESGIYQMLCEWVELTGQPWRDRLREWAAGLGCDVAILNTYTMTPIAYGKERCEQRPGDRASGDAAFEQWVDYYRDKKVEAIHGGLITLRRRNGMNWLRFDEDTTITLARPIEDLLLETIAAEDLLQLSGHDLLSERLVLRDRVRLRQFLRREGTKWTQSQLTLAVPGSFGGELDLAPLVAEFAGRFDGTRTLRELIAELAKTVEADERKVMTECLSVARQLLERGFLGKALE